MEYNPEKAIFIEMSTFSCSRHQHSLVLEAEVHAAAEGDDTSLVDSRYILEMMMMMMMITATRATTTTTTTTTTIMSICRVPHL